jgi:hypothetical protein
LLNSEKIEYLLIGGYAVAMHGYVRPTKDMDIWVSTHPANIDRLIHALVKFGVPADKVKKEWFAGPQTVFRMGFPPNRLEILTAISGVDFAECYRHRLTLEIDGVSVSVIGYDDLKQNKTASTRLSDRADVERLEKARLRDKRS